MRPLVFIDFSVFFCYHRHQVMNMKEQTKHNLSASIQGFQLPRYREIPDVGLYLEQVSKYIDQTLSPLEWEGLTGSMISNYVKKGLISSPRKKQYNRDQIGHLLFIALAKSVLSLEDLATFIRLQERTYTMEVAYDYFCLELENVLSYVFGLKEHIDSVGVENSDEKTMLRNCIIAICHKIYLEKYIHAVAAEASEE